MNRSLRFLVWSALPLLLGAAAWHITPTVVLRRQADVIRETVPGAAQYLARTVKIGRDDLSRLRASADFTPENPEVKFYLGNGADGALQGVVLFPQVNTPHGPLEVGLTLSPEGVIRNVVVTKATVETKPWVLKAVDSGFTRRFQGMRFGDDPAAALAGVDRGGLGKMPYYFAEVAATAVKRGLAFYGVLYAAPGRP